MILAATRHANAPAVVRSAVRHLLEAPTLAAALVTTVDGLSAALATTDADTTTQALCGSLRPRIAHRPGKR